MPDCGDNSCMYRDRTKPGGMRTNGGCVCDECPACGAVIRPAMAHRRKHRAWCAQPEWIPEHHRRREPRDETASPDNDATKEPR